MPLSFVSQNNSTVLIILCVVTLLVCAIYFFIEKRLEQQKFQKVLNVNYQNLRKKN